MIKYIPFYLISMLPMFILYFISDIIFVILYYVVKYRRVVVFNNLKNSFPEKSEKELKIIEKKFYRHFCDLMVESVKTLTISTKQLRKRYQIKDTALFEKFFDEDKSIILYTAHFGNWEWLAILPSYIPHQVTSFYQQQTSKYFDNFMKLLRERFGVICVESNKGYRTILKFAQKKTLTLSIMVGDQSPRKDSTKHWVKFLNQDTAFITGTDRIAKKSGQVVIFPSICKKRRGHYELDFKIIEEESHSIKDDRIIDNYARLLEISIKAWPELYLWSHKRWKLNKDINV